MLWWTVLFGPNWVRRALGRRETWRDRASIREGIDALVSISLGRRPYVPLRQSKSGADQDLRGRGQTVRIAH